MITQPTTTETTLAPAQKHAPEADRCLDRYASDKAQAAIKAIVHKMLIDGFTVSVWDGEVWTVKYSRDSEQVFNALATTDSDTIRFRRSNGELLGSIITIWQNGDEFVHDYTANDELEAKILPTLKRLIPEWWA